jgi:hypothetical protein
LFSGDKAEGTGGLVRRQKAEEKKDFKQKGGYQGGFGIRSCTILNDAHHPPGV